VNQRSIGAVERRTSKWPSAWLESGERGIKNDDPNQSRRGPKWSGVRAAESNQGLAGYEGDRSETMPRGAKPGNRTEGVQTVEPSRGRPSWATELGGPDVRRPTPRGVRSREVDRRVPQMRSRVGPSRGTEQRRTEPKETDAKGPSRGGPRRRDLRVCEPRGDEPRTSKAKGPIERTSASSDRAWTGCLPDLAGPCTGQTLKIPGGQTHLRRERAHLR